MKGTVPQLNVSAPLLYILVATIPKMYKTLEHDIKIIYYQGNHLMATTIIQIRLEDTTHKNKY